VLRPPIVLEGEVVHGDHRGRLLGFPTANLELARGIAMPARGIYAGRTLGRPAAVSIGVRPTFGDGLAPSVEVHVLGFDGDLYGRRLRVELVAFVRHEERFDSVDALVAQMADDVATVARLFIPAVRAAAPRTPACRS
jgi:riboflavin kinase / FMN adenylyltransferase